MAIITIHMRKNDGLEKKKKKIVFSHPGGSVSLPGVRELGCISGRLPDDPGGFTCMYQFHWWVYNDRLVFVFCKKKKKKKKNLVPNSDDRFSRDMAHIVILEQPCVRLQEYWRDESAQA